MKIKYTWNCPFCEYVGETRRKLTQHKKDNHNNQYHKFIFSLGGNCQYCGRECKFKHVLNYHERRCFKNPNRIEYKGHPVSEETKQKIKETNKIRHSLGGYRIGSGRGKKGWYKGYFCDSSWELAYVIYNLEHGITNFSKNFNEKFEYEINGEKHLYIPDFKFSDGHFIEVKGRKETDPVIEAKLNAVKNIEILFADDMKPYLDYVYKKYGKNFTDLYDDKIYVKKEKVIRNHEYYCKYCNNKFDTRHLLSDHLKICENHIEYKKNKKQEYKILKNKENELNNIPKDITGRYNHSIISENIWLERKEKILSCGIDLMKFGWVGKVKQSTGLTQRELENTLMHFKEEFEGKYFRRK